MGEHVPVCAHSSACKDTWVCTCVTHGKGAQSQKKVGMSPSEDTAVFGWREKWINDKLGTTSQSHFLNVLYPKSYKSNIPFWPYWSHFWKAITSVSLGI